AGGAVFTSRSFMTASRSPRSHSIRHSLVRPRLSLILSVSDPTGSMASLSEKQFLFQRGRGSSFIGLATPNGSSYGRSRHCNEGESAHPLHLLACALAEHDCDRTRRRTHKDRNQLAAVRAATCSSRCEHSCVGGS